MKKIVLFKLIVIGLIASTSVAKSADESVVYVKSNKTTAPLIEKWIAEYSRNNPSAKIVLADSNTPENENTLSLILTDDNNENEFDSKRGVLIFGKSAILPVAQKENPIFKEIGNKRLNNKRLKELYFEKDIFEEEKPTKVVQTTTVYSGNNEKSISHIFAANFGFTASDLRGKKISGDDVYLINAVEKDQSGITFNALSNIFDIESRKIKNQLLILPLDVDKQYRADFTESADIDNVIEILENDSFGDLIPIVNIGFTFPVGNKNINDFLSWVLSEGQSYNHQFGLLKLNDKHLAEQKANIENKNLISLNK